MLAAKAAAEGIDCAGATGVVVPLGLGALGRLLVGLKVPFGVEFALGSGGGEVARRAVEQVTVVVDDNMVIALGVAAVFMESPYVRGGIAVALEDQLYAVDLLVDLLVVPAVLHTRWKSMWSASLGVMPWSGRSRTRSMNVAAFICV